MNDWSVSIAIILCTYTVSLFASALLTLALIVGARHKASSFMGLNIVVFLWLAIEFCIQFVATTQEAQSLLMRAAIFISGLIVPAIAWLLSTAIPELSKSKTLYALGTANVLLGTFSALPITQLTIDASREGIAVSSDSLIYLLFLLAIFVSLGSMVGMLWRLERRHTAADTPQKAYKSLRLGLMSVLFLNIIGAFVLAGYKWSQILAPLSMVLMTQMLSVSIFRQHLIHVRDFVERALVYVAMYSVVTGIFVIASIYLLNQTILRNHETSTLQITSFAILTLALLMAQPVLKHFFDRVTDVLFFRRGYDAQKLLNRLNDKLIGQVDVTKASHDLVNIVGKGMRLSHVGVALADGKVIANTHRQASDLRQIDTESNRFSFDLLTIEEATANQHYANLANLMNQASISTISVMRDGSQHIGRIFYYSKLSGDQFRNKDIETIRLINDQAMLVLQNALRFEEISNFNGRLQEEVARATARLRKANERLKTLDQLKDDFISMASHQFRTPAASIRQALHMINSPTITAKDRKEMLRLAEADSEQLVTIVATMLSISRLQAGRFTIEKRPANLADLVEKVLLTTDILAEQKQIQLHFERPKEDIVTAVDVAKIKEAMANYIENAIKYSPSKTNVAVKLSEDGDKIRFEVTDQGMGVPEAERKRLFGKFYRAQNARREQPDGNGIGLYVVKNVAEGHGGEAYYQPQQTGGSLFGLWLPRQ